MRRLLLGAFLCALLSTPAIAQTVRIRLDAPAPPAVSVQPRWTWDADERVYIANDPNLDYDAFRYGQYYYLYSNGYWYRASAWNGRFDAIEDVSVPRVLFNLPESRYQWRSERPVYGSRWDDRDDDRYRYVRTQPRWQWMPSGQFYVAVNPDRDYDLYRAGSWYYLEDNGTWFRSASWNGPYAMIELNSVPRPVYASWRNGSSSGGTTVYAPVVRVRPRWRWMPRERVYVAVNSGRDYDMYRVGGWYYINDDGNWFRASAWNGPYVMIQDNSVPRAVFSVTNWRDHDWRDRDWRDRGWRDRDWRYRRRY